MDIFGSLSSWGFSKIFIINAHGDKTHVETIRSSVREINNKLNIHAWLLSDIDFPVDNPPVFPKPREGKFEPDYHAGANETAAVWTFYGNHQENRVFALNITPIKQSFVGVMPYLFIKNTRYIHIRFFFL